MKKTTILLILLLASFCKINAQVTLEHTYTHATKGQGAFFYVSLSEKMGKYLSLDYQNSKFTLYNIDHSVYATCKFPYVWNNYNFTISHISSTLFDCDSTNVEYAMYYYDVSSKGDSGFFVIYRTDGTELFRARKVISTYSYGAGIDPAIKSYIFQTTNGAKLVLNFKDSSTKIYSLCGNAFAGLDISKPINDIGMANAYPNPAMYSTTIEYKLPNGEPNGQLLLYDAMGRQIKSFNIDNTFSNFILNTSDMSAGEYYYSIKTSSGISEGKKLIKVK